MLPPKSGEDTTKRLHFPTAELLAALLGRQMLARSARSVRLGRLAPLASLRLSLAPLGFGSGFACLGFATPDRLAGVRPPLAVSLAPLVRFYVSLRKGKRYFREKRAFEANAHFSRKCNVWFLFRLRYTKT